LIVLEGRSLGARVGYSPGTWENKILGPQAKYFVINTRSFKIYIREEITEGYHSRLP
jgi:hypothetical protein